MEAISVRPGKGHDNLPQPSAAIERREPRPRVLLADDSETVRGLVAALLMRMGCDVDAAVNGEQALHLAREGRYDLILLDLDMPLMDGMETALEIRALPGNDRTPIMAVSGFLGGFGNPNERWRVFDGEIAKPISSERLRLLVADVWPTLRETAQDPQPGDDPLPLVDVAILDAIRLRTGAQTSTGAITTAIGEMRACAGQLELAIARGDRGRVKQAAHNLRRVALSCGAARLARYATLLVAAGKETPLHELRGRVAELVGCLAATVTELKTTP